MTPSIQTKQTEHSMTTHVDEIDSGYVHAARQSRQLERLAPLRAAGLQPGPASTTTWVGDLQQGDGGKGAMTDRLAAYHQVVVRVQGGDNAGHTTVYKDATGRDIVLKNHILPSGMRHPGTIGILANGVLINAQRLVTELEQFAKAAPDISDRVFVSGRAHLILPLHISVDERQERQRSHTGSVIGTTGRGIGPANVCKINRVGVRVHDLANLTIVEERIRAAVAFFGLPEEEIAKNLDWLWQYRDLLLEREVDSSRLINDLVETGHSVLFEGAQGPLIDFEHGIYPYVTTSPTTVHSVSTGGGFDIARVDRRVGVLKVYQTMVGNGAFVSEDFSELGDRLRTEGQEHGTTTGRDRRCGWLDLLQARWAIEINGFTSIVLTKLDVLDGFDQIGICIGYERDGEVLTEFDAEHATLEECTPIFRYFDGWRSSTKEATSFEELPAEAYTFIAFIGEQLGIEVDGVTVGPRSTDMITRSGTSLEDLMCV